MASGFIDLKELTKKQPILNSIDLNLCVQCKAVQLACGFNFCPLLRALDLYPSTEKKIEGLSSDGTIFGPTPQIFVGSQGYPRVFAGPMTYLHPDDQSGVAANPAAWVNLSLKQIIDHRFGLLRGKQSTYIQPKQNTISDRIKTKLTELSMSISPVEIEGTYSKFSNYNHTVQPGSQPIGPSGDLQTFDLTSNPSIPKPVDSIINDDLTSSQQITELYDKKFSVYYLQDLMSSGATGNSDLAKIVPTRWSITGVDDTLGKKMIPELRKYASVNEIEVRQGKLLGNYYTAIFLPGEFTFENIEAWFPGNIFGLKADKVKFSIENEGFVRKEHYKARTTYSSQAGGYYASRLAVLEQLHKLQRKARVLIIREITPEYLIPVGVWQVREGMRLTMLSSPIIFETKTELKEHLSGTLKGLFSQYLGGSITFRQTTLEDFF